MPCVSSSYHLITPWQAYREHPSAQQQHQAFPNSDNTSNTYSSAQSKTAQQTLHHSLSTIPPPRTATNTTSRANYTLNGSRPFHRTPSYSTLMVQNLITEKLVPAQDFTAPHPMDPNTYEHTVTTSARDAKSSTRNSMQSLKASNYSTKQPPPQPHCTSASTTKRPSPLYYTTNITTGMPAKPSTRQLHSPTRAGTSPPSGPPHTPTSPEMTWLTPSQKQAHTPTCPAPLQSLPKPGYELRFDKPSSTSGKRQSQTAYHHPLPTRNTYDTYHFEPPEPCFGSEVDVHPATPGTTKTPQTAHAGREQYPPTTISTSVQTSMQNVNGYTSRHPETLQRHNS
jgi:hypothetical protein